MQTRNCKILGLKKSSFGLDVGFAGSEGYRILVKNLGCESWPREPRRNCPGTGKARTRNEREGEREGEKEQQHGSFPD